MALPLKKGRNEVWFAVTERFAGILGPSLFAALGAATGSNRYALLGLGLLFVFGVVTLARIDLTADSDSGT